MTSPALYSWHHSLYIWTLHSLYLCHQDQYINYNTPTLCITSHTLCMTSHSVCMSSHEYFMTSQLYRYDITSSLFMASYPIYMITAILLSWKHNDYTWHLTHYIGHHSHCICVVTPALLKPSQQLWKSSHLAHIWHYTHCISHLIHTLWHQSSLFMTSQTLHSWHQISYIWHHIHGLWHLIPYTCDITAIISVT